MLGKICPGQVNTGMRKTGGTVHSEWRTYHEFFRRRNLIGAAREHFCELTDKAGRRMTPLTRNSRKGMTEPWSSGFPRGKGVKPRPILYIQATSKTEYVKQSRGPYKCKPLLRTEQLNRRTVIRERLIKFGLIFTKDLIPDYLICEQ